MGIQPIRIISDDRHLVYSFGTKSGIFVDYHPCIIKSEKLSLK